MAALPVSSTLNAGNNQAASVSTHFATPLAVRVADNFNNGIAGITVTWTVHSGPATVVGGATSTANAQGIATKVVAPSFTSSGNLGDAPCIRSPLPPPAAINTTVRFTAVNDWTRRCDPQVAGCAVDCTSGEKPVRFDHRLFPGWRMISRARAAILTGLVVLAGGIACGGGSDDGGPPPSGRKTVLVDNNVFQPRIVSIEPGDTIIWSWVTNSVDHNVISLYTPNFTSKGTNVLPGSGTNEVDFFDAPESHQVIFPSAGDYWYFCSTHGTSDTTGTAMNGKVVVD